MSHVQRLPLPNATAASMSNASDDRRYATDPGDPCVVALSRNSLGFWDVSSASGSRGGRFRDFRSALNYIKTEFGDAARIVGHAPANPCGTRH